MSMDPLGSSLLPKQRQLAAITEMIHTASLIHDDVLDESSTRRGERLNICKQFACLNAEYFRLPLYWE